jgi:co-chaperonin GroES (HSP10)|tara:strand:- start:1211 stop:1669 length:459 start_codon:yes stop_codon:yes gene_type:complete
MTETITVSGVGAEASVAPAMTALEEKRKQKIEEEAIEEAELEASIPKPVGYRVLIALPNIEETFGESKIVKATSTVREEYILSTVGCVLDMGAEAYSDKDRFPTGPWCKVGDYVMFRANTGTRFKVGGQEYRLMNDDSIEAVVDDPRAVSRA